MKQHKRSDEDTIHAYIHGMLSDSEATEFEIRMLDSPELADQVMLSMSMKEGFENMTRPVLREPWYRRVWVRLIAGISTPIATAIVSVYAIFVSGALLLSSEATYRSDQVLLAEYVSGVQRGSAEPSLLSLPNAQSPRLFSFSVSDQQSMGNSLLYVELSDVEGNVVWRSRAITPMMNNRQFVLIPAEVRQGKYTVRVLSEEQGRPSTPVSITISN